MSEQLTDKAATRLLKIDYKPRPRLFWARLYLAVQEHPELQCGTAYESLCARVDNIPDEVFEQDLELKHQLEAVARRPELAATNT